MLRRGASTDPPGDGVDGPVRRTRSVTVLTVSGFVVGLLMGLGGLVLAQAAVFAGGMLLAFVGLISLATARFFAGAINQQIRLAHDDAVATRKVLLDIAARPRPARARPATPEHLARAQRLLRCPRCRHQQAWSPGEEATCRHCGLKAIQLRQ